MPLLILFNTGTHCKWTVLQQIPPQFGSNASADAARESRASNRKLGSLYLAASQAAAPAGYAVQSHGYLRCRSLWEGEMREAMYLVGLDFGTTTSSAVVARTILTRSSAAGRMEIGPITDCFQSEKVFTPWRQNQLDEGRLAEYIDCWLGDVPRESILGGGALLTGLAAESSNATAIVAMVRGRLANSLVATASDPGLESWLTFLASCRRLSCEHADRPFINLDIGGGTTNLALGKHGKVLRTGCLLVGARHIEVIAGSYQICKLSQTGEQLLKAIGISKRVGDWLAPDDVAALVDCYVMLLEATLCGTAASGGSVANLLTQVPFSSPEDIGDCILTFSGGVGELIYGHLAGEPWPAVTRYGDLGIDLAQRILKSKLLAKDLRKFVPAAGGRATVYGLLRHTVELSGATVFVSQPETLPWSDVPIVGEVGMGTSDADLDAALMLGAKNLAGACLSVLLRRSTAAEVRQLAPRIADAARRTRYPAQTPLVLLMEQNLGKLLGSCITDWGSFPLNLLVVDEIPPRAAQYVRIGKLHQNVLPVSFYGLSDA